jgi:hypothetical protein
LETIMNRIATALLAAVIGATPILATATSAFADNRPSYKNGKRVYNQNYNTTPNWAGVGAGFAAGAALGVGAGLLINRPPPPPRAYYAPPPVVYYPAPAPAYYPPPPPPAYYDRGWTEAHIEWCLDRYRSYNPATNTFTGYDGYQHVCRGPY